MTESEEAGLIKKLGEDINKSIKGLEEKVKDGTDAKDKLKELEGQLDAIKDNPEKIKELNTKVEEIIVKMNRPDFGAKADKSLEKDLEETLTKSLAGKSFKVKSDTAGFVWDMGQKGLSKAANTITAANFTDGTNPVAFNPNYESDVVTSPTRKVHMRSVISQSSMSGDGIRYAQHASHGEGEIGIQVAQGDKKQQIEEKYEMVDLTARQIAGFYRIAKQELADIPWLAQNLLSEGTERYLKVEDAEILYGTGGSGHLKGINEFADLFDGDMPNFYEAILNPIFELLDSDEDPSATLLRPMTYVNLLKYKTSEGAYNFPMLFVPNQMGPMSIAGVPILMSTAVRVNEGFVGDWGSNNVQIRVREGLSIDFAYEDADNFTENLVTIRLEARIALQLKRAAAFRKINFANVAPVI